MPPPLVLIPCCRWSVFRRERPPAQISVRVLACLVWIHSPRPKGEHCFCRAAGYFSPPHFLLGCCSATARSKAHERSGQRPPSSFSGHGGSDTLELISRAARQEPT